MFQRNIGSLSAYLRLSLFLSAALWLAACGGGGNDFPESDPNTPPTTEAPPPPAETTTASTAPPPANTTTPTEEEEEEEEDHGHSHRPWWRPRTLALASVAPSAPPPTAQIEMSAQGSGIAIWREYDGVQHNLWASHYDGLAWGGARLLENAAGDITATHLALDLTGNALVVWDQANAAAGSDIFASSYRTGGGWGAPQMISQPVLTGAIASRAFGARVGFASDGSATATWQQIDTNGFSRTWFNIFTPPIGWAGAIAQGS